jgi:hypothetical protein
LVLNEGARRGQSQQGDSFVLNEGGGGPQRSTQALALDRARLTSLGECLVAADTAAAMRCALARPGPIDLAAAPRASAVRKCITFVNGLLASAETASLPMSPRDDEVLCGWPVRSFNEWGVAQERILVLSLHALWRLEYRGEWSKVDHFSRTPLADVCAVRARAGDAGFALSLTKRDGRANPLKSMLARTSRAVPGTRPRGAFVSHTRSQPTFERGYAVVASDHVPAPIVRTLVVAAIDAAVRLRPQPIDAHHALPSSLPSSLPVSLLGVEGECEFI